MIHITYSTSAARFLASLARSDLLFLRLATLRVSGPHHGAYTAQRSYSLQREDLYIHPLEPGTIDFILLERNVTCFFRRILFRIGS